MPYITHYHEPARPVALPHYHFGQTIGGRIIVAGPRKCPLGTLVDITCRGGFQRGQKIKGGVVHGIIGDRTAARFDGRWDIPRDKVLSVWGLGAVRRGVLVGTVRVVGRKRK